MLLYIAGKNVLMFDIGYFFLKAIFMRMDYKYCTLLFTNPGANEPLIPRNIISFCLKATLFCFTHPLFITSKLYDTFQERSGY